MVIADGVQASIPAVGMAVVSAGARVAIKDDEDWSLLAQDSSSIFDLISKEFVKYRA
ncbi:UNVERIFIED_CONTAM: hypothetical protein NO986_05790 [Comamonas sp. A-3]|uniref:hypothetical protein n=1 Tax=Comamonas TaxID=283 RepID=UPI000B0DCD04|nr:MULTISPECIES: hypothetical protein [Comamonas]QOQ80534.1 hypothetical protein INP81_14195 [Comamonas thiooxydans]UUE95523.1 hypothetical protein MJ608_07760 [Comamonas thiooxydans]